MNLRNVREKLRDDMELFGRVVSGAAYYLPTPDFHREIYKVLTNDKIKRWLIVAPRGHAKSTIAGKIKPLHHLFYAKTETGPRIILLVSKTQGHSIRLLSTVKTALNQNKFLRAIYGEWGESTALKWQEKYVILKDGSAIYALGTGGQMVGFKEGDQRPTLILLDDPEDKENTKTRASMDNNYMWLMQEALPALSESGEFGIIGTPIRQGCLVEKLKPDSKTGESLFNYLHFSAELDPDKKLALWPQKMSWSSLKYLQRELKKKGRESFYTANYLCKITSDSTKLFRATNWKYFKMNNLFKLYDRWYLDIETDNNSIILPVNLYFGVDPASSTDPRACDSANCVSAVDHQKNYYIIEEWADKVDPLEHAKLIIDWIIRYHPLNNVAIESVGYQTFLRSYIRESMKTPEGKLYKAGIRHVRGLENKEIPRESKTERYREGLQPIQASQKIYVQQHQAAWRQQFELYVGPGDPSDRIDAFYYTSIRAKRPIHPPLDDIKEDMDDLYGYPWAHRKGKINWKTA